jgi:hypothetical protein
MVRRLSRHSDKVLNRMTIDEALASLCADQFGFQPSFETAVSCADRSTSARAGQPNGASRSPPRSRGERFGVHAHLLLLPRRPDDMSRFRTYRRRKLTATRIDLTRLLNAIDTAIRGKAHSKRINPHESAHRN